MVQPTFPPHVELCIAECAKIEENLWRLLHSGKKGTLHDQHEHMSKIFNSLQDVVMSRLDNAISEIEKLEHSEKESIIRYAVKIHEEFMHLKTLMEKQGKELKNVLQLSNEQIASILDGNKHGAHISETSQRIRALLKQIEQDVIFEKRKMVGKKID